MIEGLGFLAGQREDLLHPRRVRNTARGFRFLTGANLLFDRRTHGFEVESHFLQHADGHALAEFDQPEQNMLRAHVIVMEAIRFLAGQREHLLSAGRKIIHRFLGHGRLVNFDR